jgi:hypothetical protein
MNPPPTKRHKTRHQSIPWEVIDLIIEAMPDPKSAYQVAVALMRPSRYKYLQKIPAASMDSASKKGQIDLLNWWRDSRDRHYYSNAVIIASQNGHVDVLEWWKTNECHLNRDMPFLEDDDELWRTGRFIEQALITASKEGHIAVLDWWKESGNEKKDLSCPDWAMAYAEMYQKTKVVEWWFASGLEIPIK